MRFNPFVPNGIVSPGMFTGRYEEIETAEQALFQTKNGNPQHFIFEGERGIGKSSLAYYIEIVASGRIEGVGGNFFKFLTVSIELAGIDTKLGIIRQIGRELKRKLDESPDAAEYAKKAWNFLKNWEVLGVKYNAKKEEFDEDEAQSQLISSFINIIDDSEGQIDGIFLLVDEADGPSAEAGLGEFMKIFTERLMKRGCNEVLIGLAGLPTLVPKLRASHESSPRLFQIINVSTLSEPERLQVIDSGLRSANEKNPMPVSIDPDASELIANLSEGYPHFLQQFSYFAFDVCKTNRISKEDVKTGAYMENGALSQLGDKYFSEMYHARIWSEEYRKVLKFLASFGDAWVSRSDIVKGCDVSQSNINNALSALKSREIINQDASRRGYYRLPTKSFAAWINAIGNDAENIDSEFHTKPPS
ncbi:MAG: ATP-binding protein [Sulfitobacter sp.]